MPMNPILSWSVWDKDISFVISDGEGTTDLNQLHMNHHFCLMFLVELSISQPLRINSQNSFLQ
jgi:hypothetical protein